MQVEALSFCSRQVVHLLWKSKRECRMGLPHRALKWMCLSQVSTWSRCSSAFGIRASLESLRQPAQHWQSTTSSELNHTWVTRVVNLADELNRSARCAAVALSSVAARAKYLKHCLLYYWLIQGKGRLLGEDRVCAAGIRISTV